MHTNSRTQLALLLPPLTALVLRLLLVASLPGLRSGAATTGGWAGRCCRNLIVDGTFNVRLRKPEALAHGGCSLLEVRRAGGAMLLVYHVCLLVVLRESKEAGLLIHRAKDPGLLLLRAQGRLFSTPSCR